MADSMRQMIIKFDADEASAPTFACTSPTGEVMDIRDGFHGPSIVTDDGWLLEMYHTKSETLTIIVQDASNQQRRVVCICDATTFKLLRFNSTQLLFTSGSVLERHVFNLSLQLWQQARVGRAVAGLCHHVQRVGRLLRSKVSPGPQGALLQHPQRAVDGSPRHASPRRQQLAEGRRSVDVAEVCGPRLDERAQLCRAAARKDFLVEFDAYIVMFHAVTDHTASALLSCACAALAAA